jgi:hypothetical protein
VSLGASDGWIVVAAIVVMRPGLGIVVLAGQYSNRLLPYRAPLESGVESARAALQWPND